MKIIGVQEIPEMPGKYQKNLENTTYKKIQKNSRKLKISRYCQKFQGNSRKCKKMHAVQSIQAISRNFINFQAITIKCKKFDKYNANARHRKIIQGIQENPRKCKNFIEKLQQI